MPENEENEPENGRDYGIAANGRDSAKSAKPEEKKKLIRKFNFAHLRDFPLMEKMMRIEVYMGVWIYGIEQSERGSKRGKAGEWEKTRQKTKFHFNE